MRSMQFYLRIYRKLAASYLKGLMSFKADFFLGMVGVLFMNILGILSIVIIFKTIPSLAEWNYYELVFLYGFLLAISIPFGLFFERMWHLGESLWLGDFMLYYFKPIIIFFSFVSESINIKALSQIILSIFLLIYSGIKLRLDWNLYKIFLSVIFYLGSSLIYLGLMIAASATAFWTGQNHSIMDFLMKLNDFSRYPFSIFSKPLRFVFTYLLPYVFMAYYPVKILLREQTFTVSWLLTPAVGIIVMIFACFLWSMGVRSYTGTGS